MGDEKHAELEVLYMVFCLAQFLGFVEVVRREGPREISFLAKDNPQGSDTLFIMIEAIRFVLCASPKSLEDWWSQEDQGRGREIILVLGGGESPMKSSRT